MFGQKTVRTGYAGKQLAGEALNLAVGKGDEIIALKKVEHALTQQVHNDADVAAVVEAVSEVNAPVAILRVVGLERFQDSELNLAGFAVLLHRANDLDGDQLPWTLPVLGLDDFAERALSKQLDHLICFRLASTGCPRRSS